VRHPSEQDLALLAGGDLRGLKGWLARQHVASCASCQTALGDFEASRAEARIAGDEMPDGVNWNTMALDMRANIRVGLDAAACVRPAAPVPSAIGWRPAVALASLTAVLLVGWMLNAPRFTSRPFVSLEANSAVVEAGPAGVELKRGARGFALLNPRSNNVRYSVDSRGAKAQFVDIETGQVTITNVAID
jgi:hypothetical protein